MKKIVSTSVVLVVIGGLAFGAYSYSTKDRSFEKNQSYNTDNIESLKVDSDSWDVSFKKSDSNELTISAEGKRINDNPVTFMREGEAVVIKQNDQEQSGFFGGFTFGKRGTIHINVPEPGVNKIEITSEDGNIAMSEISADHFVVKSNAGDGKFEGVSAATGKFASRDGMLSMKDSSIDELDITSTSGDNYMKNVKSSETKVSSVDGIISMEEIYEGKSLEVDTEAGDIEVSYKKAPTSLSVTAQSVSSEIALDIKEFKKSKDTGNFKKGKVGQGINELNLTSEDGLIKVTD